MLHDMKRFTVYDTDCFKSHKEFEQVKSNITNNKKYSGKNTHIYILKCTLNAPVLKLNIKHSRRL